MVVLVLRLPEAVPDGLLVLDEDVAPAQDVPGLLGRRLADVGREPLEAHDCEDHLPNAAHRHLRQVHQGVIVLRSA